MSNLNTTLSAITFALSLLVGCGGDPCDYDPSAKGCVAETGSEDTGDGSSGEYVENTWQPFPGSIWYNQVEPTEPVFVGDLLSSTYYEGVEGYYSDPEAEVDWATIVDCATEDCETVQVYEPYSWTSRCDPDGLPTTTFQGSIPFPTDRTFGPATPSNSPNEFVVIRNDDGETMWEVNAAENCVAPDGTEYVAGWVLPDEGTPAQVNGDGLHKGARGGSHLTSAINVTEDELLQCGVDRSKVKKIGHAVPLQIWRWALYLSESETDGQAGYRWPALSADSYAADVDPETDDGSINYKGEIPELQMGSWLYVDPTIDCNELAGSDPEDNPKFLICRALQEYGGPVSDDSWIPGRVMFAAEIEAVDGFEDACGYPIIDTFAGDEWFSFFGKMLENMYVEDQPKTALGYDE